MPHDEPVAISQLAQRGGEKPKKRPRGEKWARHVKAVGARLRAIRLAMDPVPSLATLAKKAGTDKGTLSKIEKGQVPEVAAGLFFDICAALGADPVAVWWGADRRPQSEPPQSDVRPSVPPRG